MISKYATQTTDIQNIVRDVKNVNKLKMNLCLSFLNKPTTYYHKPKTHWALFAKLRCSLPLHIYCEVLTQKSQALNM
jgi:predicted transposase YbfD/YdcC